MIRELGLIGAGAIAGDVARRGWQWWQLQRVARRELGIIPVQYQGSRALRRAYARGIARGMVAHDTRVRRTPRPSWRLRLARVPIAGRVVAWLALWQLRRQLRQDGPQ